MKNYFKDLITPKQLAEATGKQYPWIMRIMPELVEAGLAKQFDKPFICHKSAIDYINTRPETRGKKASAVFSIKFPKSGDGYEIDIKNPDDLTPKHKALLETILNQKEQK